MDQENPLPQESEKHQHVTIPYFLYEAMAKVYYAQPTNADVPVQTPAIQREGNLNLSQVQFNPSDVPPTWRAGGVAARKQKHGSSEVQAP